MLDTVVASFYLNDLNCLRWKPQNSWLCLLSPTWHLCVYFSFNIHSCMPSSTCQKLSFYLFPCFGINHKIPSSIPWWRVCPIGHLCSWKSWYIFARLYLLFTHYTRNINVFILLSKIVENSVLKRLKGYFEVAEHALAYDCNHGSWYILIGMKPESHHYQQHYPTPWEGSMFSSHIP